jgi:hypothetical protein
LRGLARVAEEAARVALRGPCRLTMWLMLRKRRRLAEGKNPLPSKTGCARRYVGPSPGVG